MAILNNVPTLSYITIKDMIIIHDGVIYQIQNTYSCKPYFYWNKENPYELQTSNKILEEIVGRYYIIFNDKGTHTLVPQTEIQIDFSEGVSKDYITDRILGFKGQSEEVGNRFTTIEETLEGIRTTVGTVQEDVTNNTISISELEQRSDSISADISRIETIYNNDLESSALREDTIVALLQFQSTLGIFGSDMNTYMEDNDLTSGEKEAIELYKEELENNRLTLNARIDTIIGLMEAQGQTEMVAKLTNIKENLNESTDTLISTVDNACIDKLFTNSEMATIISCFSNVNIKVNETRNLINDCIYLGTGGEIIKELSSINMKQDEIRLNVSRTESTLKNTLGVQKSLLQGVIDANNNALLNFKNSLSSVVADRLISVDELSALNKKVGVMESEKTNLESKKDEMINNPLISDTEKYNLIERWNVYNSSYIEMLEMMDEINSDGKIDSTELANMNARINLYYNELDNLHSSMCDALDNISNNEINKAIDDAKEEILTEVNELSEKVDGIKIDVDASVISGLVDNQEKADILQNLDALSREKMDIDNRYNQWYSSEFLYGDLKESYRQMYEIYVEKYDALVNICSTVANKTDLVEESERIAMETATDEFLVALNNFLKQSETVIDVVTSNETTYAKNNLIKEFNDINNMLNNLNEEMNNSFKDGIITEIELTNIENILTQIDKEKMDIDETYNEVYNNSNL